MSGEEWLALYDKVFKPLPGVSLTTVAAILTPLYAKMGIQTARTRTEQLAQPTGLVIVEVLCALARHGFPLDTVHQGAAGCVFEAKLPSDLWTLAGKIVVTVERAGPGTRVSVATTIPGTLFDWGKSNRCLDHLFHDLHGRAA